jgi:hypothetical protein
MRTVVGPARASRLWTRYSVVREPTGGDNGSDLRGALPCLALPLFSDSRLFFSSDYFTGMYVLLFLSLSLCMHLFGSAALLACVFLFGDSLPRIGYSRLLRCIISSDCFAFLLAVVITAAASSQDQISLYVLGPATARRVRTYVLPAVCAAGQLAFAPRPFSHSCLACCFALLVV